MHFVFLNIRRYIHRMSTSSIDSRGIYIYLVDVTLLKWPLMNDPRALQLTLTLP